MEGEPSTQALYQASEKYNSSAPPKLSKSGIAQGVGRCQICCPVDVKQGQCEANDPKRCVTQALQAPRE